MPPFYGVFVLLLPQILCRTDEVFWKLRPCACLEDGEDTSGQW